MAIFKETLCVPFSQLKTWNAQMTSKRQVEKGNHQVALYEQEVSFSDGVKVLFSVLEQKGETQYVLKWLDAENSLLDQMAQLNPLRMFDTLSLSHPKNQYELQVVEIY